MRFVGDGFVKSNVIIRLLQSEVDHVQKDDPAATALSDDNYKFSYKGTTQLQNRLVHVFQLKPRKQSSRPVQRKDLSRRAYRKHGAGRGQSGEITISIHQENRIRAGLSRKSVAFTFPVHIHSEARTRLVGRAVVDIYHYDYQPVPSHAAPRS